MANAGYGLEMSAAGVRGQVARFSRFSEFKMDQLRAEGDEGRARWRIEPCICGAEEVSARLRKKPRKKFGNLLTAG